MGTLAATVEFCSNDELVSFLSESGNRIVHSIWRKYKKPVEFDEFMQEARIVIAKALPRYDERRVDTKKETFIYQCVMNCCKMMIRKQHSKKTVPVNKQFSFETLVGREDARVSDLDRNCPLGFDSWVDSFADDPIREDDISLDVVYSAASQASMETKVIKDQRKEQLKKALKEARLTAEEMSVLQGFLKGLNQTEIGRSIGTSQAQVSKLYTKALIKLRAALLHRKGTA